MTDFVMPKNKRGKIQVATPAPVEEAPVVETDPPTKDEQAANPAPADLSCVGESAPTIVYGFDPSTASRDKSVVCAKVGDSFVVLGEYPAKDQALDAMVRFNEWLKTPAGQDASDPRFLPEQAVRRQRELERRLKLAWDGATAADGATP